VLFTDGISEAHCSGDADQLDDIGITAALKAAPSDAGVVVVQIERPTTWRPTDGHV
jgi:hypothetical protein